MAEPQQKGPTLQSVWDERSAAGQFPTALVEGARDAISFFAAGFYGRNDVIFLHHLGVRDIVLVDIDSEKLAVMAKIYPSVTEVIADDAFATANRMRQAGRTYDVVTCDPFTNVGWPILGDYFDTFASLVRRSFVTGVTTGDLEQAGVPATLDGIQAWLDAHGRHDWKAAWFAVRNEQTRLAWLGLRHRV